MSKTIDLPATIRRDATLEVRAAADGESIEVSISSEQPVERYTFVEVLGHGADEVDLAAFGPRGLPLLRDHRNSVDSVVGRVTDPELRGGKLYAKARFAEDEASQALRARVLRGELGELSVGYSIERMELVRDDKGKGRTYRATRWTPRECSLVAVPADYSVGVGRGQGEEGIRRVPVTNEEGQNMGDDVKAPAKGEGQSEEQRKAAEATRAADLRAEAEKMAAEQVKADRERCLEIDKLGARFNVPRDTVDKAKRNGLTVEQFNGVLVEHLGSDASRAFARASSIGLTDGEARHFSLVRLIHAMAVDPSDRRAREAAAFELEACEAAAEKAKGRTAKGVLVPMDVLARGDFGPLRDPRQMQRDLQVSDGGAGTGGQMVATDLLAGSFIDMLRNRTITMPLGATVLDNLQGNVAIPKQTGGATAYWLGEADTVTESTPTIGQVAMAPHTVGAWTNFSRRLALQASLSVETLVRNDLAATLAIAIDHTAINGSADTDAPDGIADDAGINTVTLATASSPTWAEVVQCFGEVAADNAARGSLGYAMHPLMMATLMAKPKVSGDSSMIMPTQDQLAGFRAEWSPQVASTDLWFANWADLIMGFWGGLEIQVDPYSLSTSQQTRVTAFQDVDFGLRHAVSFCRAKAA